MFARSAKPLKMDTPFRFLVKGVPQGSPLSPLLYLLGTLSLTKDLPHNKLVCTTVFADSISIAFHIFTNAKRMSKIMNNTLQIIESKANNLGLELNKKECKYIFCKIRRITAFRKYNIVGQREKKHLRILGSYFSKKLSEKKDLDKAKKFVKKALVSLPER
ncbi:hypothetical protein GJ496_008292 [Pomphorhynchus laevis]|nr:hypothetical protein GJ496_008292 [Pomphorhynchus laevis]